MFLPATPEELKHAGWDALDVILVTGDAYIAYARYVIPEGTALYDITGGMGFYILGDTDLPFADATFTHTNEYDGTQISDGLGNGPSGVRLYNEGGGIESPGG